MREIPLSTVPFQTVSAVVNGQNYRVTVRQLGDMVVTSLMVDGIKVTEGVAAVALGPLIPWAQTVAKTMIYWKDTQGTQRPRYTELGTRWILVFEENNE